jgi:hypothetical protein
MNVRCTYLDTVMIDQPNTNRCGESLESGDTWVHLRCAAPADMSAAAMTQKTTGAKTFSRDLASHHHFDRTRRELELVLRR